MSRVVVFNAYGGPDVLEIIDVDPPEPGPGQVRVRVKASGVQPFDAKHRSGAAADFAPASFPQPQGVEFAGVVDKLGPDVGGVSPGDEVIGWTSGAVHADHTLANAAALVAKPADLSWAEAGALTASGQTAHGALRALGIGPGETVLVHAAAGGVGTIAVQLVKAWGATAIGTASPPNHDYLRALGAIPISYGDGLTTRIHDLASDGVAAALDASGTEAAMRASLDVVSDQDRIGALTAFDVAARLGVRVLNPERSVEQLAELVDLCRAGQLKVHIHKAFPLAEVAAAHREVESGHVRGKVVLVTE